MNDKSDEKIRLNDFFITTLRKPKLVEKIIRGIGCAKYNVCKQSEKLNYKNNIDISTMV